jgi:hypothetical protein
MFSNVCFMNLGAFSAYIGRNISYHFDKIISFSNIHLPALSLLSSFCLKSVLVNNIMLVYSCLLSPSICLAYPFPFFHF